MANTPQNPNEPATPNDSTQVEVELTSKRTGRAEQGK